MNEQDSNLWLTGDEEAIAGKAHGGGESFGEDNSTAGKMHGGLSHIGAELVLGEASCPKRYIGRYISVG